jgi:hypothetical protein
MRRVARAKDDGKVVNLAAEGQRRRRVLPAWEVDAYSGALRLAEPRSKEYWRTWSCYLHACWDVER